MAPGLDNMTIDSIVTRRPVPPPGRRFQNLWIPAVAAWQFLGTGAALLLASPKPNFHGFIFTLMFSLSVVNAVGVVGSLVFLLYERSVRPRIDRRVVIAMGFILAAAVSVAASLKFVPLLVRRICDPRIPHDVDKGHVYAIAFNLLTGALIISAYVVIHIHRKLDADWKAKVAEIELLKTMQVEAKLALLQSKINPHFLFNTLNTVLDLVERSPRKVESVILNLSDLYRKILSLPESAPISLAEELDLVRRYLEIEKVRLEDRLEYRIDAEPGLLSVRIPPLVVQALVENAVVHGLVPRKDGGRVDIAACAAAGRIRITVADNGVGISAPSRRSGFGLPSVEERLRLFAGADAEFSIRSSGSGTTVALGFPYVHPSNHRRG